MAVYTAPCPWPSFFSPRSLRRGCVSPRRVAAARRARRDDVPRPGPPACLAVESAGRRQARRYAVPATAAFCACCLVYLLVGYTTFGNRFPRSRRLDPTAVISVSDVFTSVIDGSACVLTVTCCHMTVHRVVIQGARWSLLEHL